MITHFKCHNPTSKNISKKISSLDKSPDWLIADVGADAIITSKEKKHLSSVLVSNGYPLSF